MTNQKRLESAARNAVSNRNYRRARARAMTRLTHLFPDQYKELLEREKQNDEILGKKWTDLDGSPAPITRTILANHSSEPKWEVDSQDAEREGNS